MTASPAGFEFTNDRPAAAEGRLVVRIPSGLNRKRRVLNEYARQLRFPAYFGWNWDAFEECLRDLSWLEDVKEIVIAHRDVPFESSLEQRETYLAILHDLVTVPDARGPRFRVLFPRGGEDTMTFAWNPPRES